MKGQPAWRPDGQAVAFLSARHQRRGLDPGQEVLEVDLASGEQRTLIERGTWGLVSYRPDGVAACWLGNPILGLIPTIFSLWRVEESGELTDLTGHLDRSVMTYSPAISSGWSPMDRGCGHHLPGGCRAGQGDSGRTGGHGGLAARWRQGDHRSQPECGREPNSPMRQ